MDIEVMRGRSAVARRVINSGTGATNGTMSPLGYWGGNKKGGLPPSTPSYAYQEQDL